MNWTIVRFTSNLDVGTVIARHGEQDEITQCPKVELNSDFENYLHKLNLVKKLIYLNNMYKQYLLKTLIDENIKNSIMYHNIQTITLILFSKLKKVIFLSLHQLEKICN